MTAAEQIRREGYAVLEGAIDEGQVGELRAAIASLAAPYSPLAGPQETLAAGVFRTATGLGIPDLATTLPDLSAPTIPAAEAVLRELLGDYEQELLGAAVSDEHRPLFAWHTHIDRVDEGERVRAGAWPERLPIVRLLTLLYLDDVNDVSGEVLVWPRHENEPTAPPHPIEDPDWSGARTLAFCAGSMLILSEATWHAARPRTAPGRRIFVGGYYRTTSAASSV